MSEVDKLRAQVATLATFGGHALRSDDLYELLQEATQLVSDALDTELVKVLELLPDKQTMLVRAGVNWNPGVVGHATISAGDGSAAGHALRTGTPVISDVATETRFDVPELLREHDVLSTVNVLIRGDDGPFGVLEVDSRQRREFNNDDVSFLQTYANLLAAAVDRLNKQRELTANVKKQQMLLDELQHRVNNMLMTIRAVAQLTRARSSDLDEFVRALDRRLGALARSHAMLSQPGSVTTLREVLAHELAAEGINDGDGLLLRGPDVVIPSRQAQLVWLVCHELATNAVKHGALSVENGRIEVVWALEKSDCDRVRLRWREHGVSIKSDPARRGTGSDILERSITAMHGTICRTFHSDGIECDIDFRIEK